MTSYALRASMLALLLTSGAYAAIGPSLEARLSRETGLADVIIVLSPAPDVLSRSTIGRPSCAAANARSLQSAHEEQLGEFLSRAGAAGVVLGELKTFWLGPAVAARVNLNQIPQLESLPGVAAVIEDAPVELLAPARNPAPSPSVDATAAAFDLLGVRSLWHEGITGSGTLVASLDTGVDGLHPALKSRYRGLRAEAAASWRDQDGDPTPDDPDGHGTHTMGTVLGCEPGDTVGVAPEAEWIAAGVVDRGRSLGQTISDLLDAFQWLADPDGNPDTRTDRPDVVLNSWGIPQGVLPECDATFWSVVDQLEALGTVVVFAAGNEGPGDYTIRQPADRGDVYLSCFAVGAVDALNPAAGAMSFSSRGPTMCYPGRIKPELVAPGVNVRSCAAGGGYRLSSGTSMAAPYVAGALCLLRQYSPESTPFELKEALVRSAVDLPPAGPDYATGYGLLNVRAAMAYLKPASSLEWKIALRQSHETSSLPTGLTVASGDVEIDNLGRSLRGVHVTVVPRSEHCTVSDDVSPYFDFVSEGEGVMVIPVTLVTDVTVPSGDRVWADLIVHSDSPRLDTTLTVGIQVGRSPMRSATAVNSAGLAFLVTNTGRFDTSGAEAVSVQPLGFAYHGVTIPFSGGLQISTPSREVSSFGDNDFEPANAEEQTFASTATLLQNRFRDTRYPDPLGVEIDQAVRTGSEGPGAYLLLEYQWSRLWNGSEPFSAGAWFHWQPASGSVRVTTGHSGEACFQGDGVYFGAVWLGSRTSDVSFAPYDPTAEALPQGVASPASSDSYWTFFKESAQAESTGKFTLAMVAAHSQAEWQEAAARARSQFVAEGGSDGPVTPSSFELFASYPNPFNPSTTVRFALPEASDVRLDIFNALGQRVATPLSRHLAAGQHSVTWHARSDQDVPLPSGLYLVRVTAAGQVRTGKMTLLR